MRFIRKLYHGTSNEAAELILQSKEMIPGDDGDNEDYLGKAIYFFDDIDEALDWNIGLYKKKCRKMNEKKRLNYYTIIRDYKVIEADISIENSEILNLNDKRMLKSILELYKEYIDVLKCRYSNSFKGNFAEFINYMYEEKLIDYKMIKKDFNRSTAYRTKMNDGRFTQWSRTVYAVKDKSVINDIRLCANITKQDYKEVEYFC